MIQGVFGKMGVYFDTKYIFLMGRHTIRYLLMRIRTLANFEPLIKNLKKFHKKIRKSRESLSTKLHRPNSSSRVLSIRNYVLFRNNEACVAFVVLFVPVLCHPVLCSTPCIFAIYLK